MNEFEVYGIVAVIFIIIIAGLWCIAVVPAGGSGVRDTFGNVENDYYSPGLYLKAPWTNVVNMTLQTQRYDAQASAASSDLQEVQTEVTLNYHLDGSKSVNVYKTVGVNYSDKVIVPAVQESVKASTAEFTAEELIDKRPLVKDAIDKALTARLATYGIIVETTSITDFKFSDQFTTAIEAKVVQAQSALQAQNKLQQVQIEAQQAQAVATGQANAIKTIADAQAYQLEVINSKLTQNPLLVEYKAIEKWSGTMPLVTGAATPFVSLGSIIDTNN